MSIFLFVVVYILIVLLTYKIGTRDLEIDEFLVKFFVLCLSLIWPITVAIIIWFIYQDKKRK